MINIKYKNIGKSTKLFCEACENINYMELLYIFHSLDIFSVCVTKSNKEIIAVCPFCGKIKKVSLSFSQIKSRKFKDLYTVKPCELKERE